MREMILVLGGARSGKSSYAERLAADRGGSSVLYVATAEIRDEEMAARVVAHRAQRPSGWCTLEAPHAVGAAIEDNAAGCEVVLLDCITLLASNAVLSLGDDVQLQDAEAAVLAEVGGLLDAYHKLDLTWIIVSNEVGLGLVPPYRLGRIYRDALGRANQRLAAEADSVLFMVAGLPLHVK